MEDERQRRLADRHRRITQRRAEGARLEEQQWEILPTGAHIPVSPERTAVAQEFLRLVALEKIVSPDPRILEERRRD